MGVKFFQVLHIYNYNCVYEKYQSYRHILFIVNMPVLNVITTCFEIISRGFIVYTET